MIFVHSRKDTTKTAEAILELATKYGTRGDFQQQDEGFFLIKDILMKFISISVLQKTLIYYYEE